MVNTLHEADNKMMMMAMMMIMMMMMMMIIIIIIIIIIPYRPMQTHTKLDLTKYRAPIISSL